MFTSHVLRCHWGSKSRGLLDGGRGLSPVRIGGSYSAFRYRQTRRSVADGMRMQGQEGSVTWAGGMPLAQRSSHTQPYIPPFTAWGI